MTFDARSLAGLAILTAVAEHRSFSMAGRAIGMSPSGVSRAMAKLEDNLGVRLVDRSSRTLRLTREGERLYRMALPHLEGLGTAFDTTSSAAHEVRGALRVSLNTIFARHLFAPALPAFVERFPSLDLEILHLPETGTLLASGIDLAIRFGPQPDSTMSVRRLLETRVMTVATPDYLARFGHPQRPDTLARHECLQFLDPQTGKPFPWEFHRGGEILPVATRGQFTFTDVDLMTTACLAGVGVAQLLEISARDWLSGGALVELFPDWAGERFPLYAVRPSRRLSSAAAEAFLDFCVGVCTKDQAAPPTDA
ncbi:LysR family transcriptional regulator [Acuticoccus sediminis]|uniref:LysR family transcriptional regulator n=1 Tax=Acuticoccus sediminis TaxID=2184697 RepID=UPI001CFE371B|nr:LysR family transcriptional regulator [Acuticoccus sediminis]